jgi:Fe-Mn family superoxide dismutase
MTSNAHEASSINEIRNAFKEASALLDTPTECVRAHAGTAPIVHTLPPLPYAENELAPVLSPHTIAVHHGQHHRQCVDSLNKLISRTPFAAMSLESIILCAAHSQEHAAVYRAAAETWSHAFYWRSLHPRGGGALPASLKASIDASFGSVPALKMELTSASTAQFGSGWVWLVTDATRLRVIATGNTDVPLTRKFKPVLAIDVWEHAYYLDFKHRRAEYVTGVLDKLINWEFAADNLRSAAHSERRGDA